MRGGESRPVAGKTGVIGGTELGKGKVKKEKTKEIKKHTLRWGKRRSPHPKCPRTGIGGEREALGGRIGGSCRKNP